MQKPNIYNMFEFAIKVNESLPKHITLFNKVMPTVSILKDKCSIKWYCFHLHNENNGVPIELTGAQYHFRFENTCNLTPEQLKDCLPDYCLMIRKIEKPLDKISGIDTSLLKNEDIAEAWRIIGESCEWVVNMLSVHGPIQKISISELNVQIMQYQHFIKNITNIEFK